MSDEASKAWREAIKAAREFIQVREEWGHAGDRLARGLLLEEALRDARAADPATIPSEAAYEQQTVAEWKAGRDPDFAAKYEAQMREFAKSLRIPMPPLEEKP